MRKSVLITIIAFSVLLSLLVGGLRVFFPNGLSSESSSKESSRTPPTDAKSQENESSPYEALNYETVKAVWISQFDASQIYTENGAQRSKADYTEKIKTVIKNLSFLGINTVFFQLRPNGDSIYPSKLFPTSKYVSGAYGKDTEYDAFQIFLEYAHQASISVHAWINPLRCMKNSEISLISNEYQIKKWYTEASPNIVTVDGYCYLNPAYDEVTELICGGVEEIMEKYDVDGIHIDDYFYPTTAESFDAEAYSEYKKSGGILSLADFRRERINRLVREIYAAVKNSNPSVLFGVSPAGNVERNYNELYADVAEWCSVGCYIDYICPQVYFGFEHQTHAFNEVCDTFSNMIKTDGIKLIIGMTLGKAYDACNGSVDVWAGAGEREWIENRDVLKRSLEYIKTIQNCEGAAFFSYRFFFDASTGAPVTETKDEIAAFLPILNGM